MRTIRVFFFFALASLFVVLSLSAFYFAHLDSRLSSLSNRIDRLSSKPPHAPAGSCPTEDYVEEFAHSSASTRWSSEEEMMLALEFHVALVCAMHDEALRFAHERGR